MSFVNAMAGKTRVAARRWRALATACLAHVLHDGYADMLYLLFPFWQRELSLSFTQVGLLKTLYSGSMAAAQVPAGRLGARFTCAAALVMPGGLVVPGTGREWVVTRHVEGRLVRVPRGSGGFGYDPIFVPHGFDQTTAEMTPEAKDAISHRGRAFRALAPFITGECP